MFDTINEKLTDSSFIQSAIDLRHGDHDESDDEK